VTALPDRTPESKPEPRLLTVAEYMALGETEPGYTELQEGHLLMTPSPRPKHSNASLNLAVRLLAQLPAGLTPMQDMDVDLELAPTDEPGFVRRPDLIVVDASVSADAEAEDRLIRAAELHLVVEIVSPGSRRMDYVIKRGEYADAEIPYYWILDLNPPISLLTCHLAGEFGYQDSGTYTGTFRAVEPFPVEFELDDLPLPPKLPKSH
jgi:Uma2 family endonuclease